MSAPSLPSSASAGLERSVLAVLGSASAQALHRLGPRASVTLYCWAALVAARGVPPVMVVGRVSRILQRAFTSVAVGASLQAASVPGELGLSVLNLLALYMLAAGWGGQAVEGASEYQLVSFIARAVAGLGGAGLPVLFAAYCLAQVAPVHPSLPRLCSMCMVHYTTRRLALLLPEHQYFLCVTAVLYLTHPFVALFPVLDDLFSFAIYAVSTDLHLRAVPLWQLACAFWALWRLAPDEVGQRVGAMAGANVLAVAMLQGLQPVLDADPAPVVLSILIALDIASDFLLLTSAGSVPKKN